MAIGSTLGYPAPSLLGSPSAPSREASVVGSHVVAPSKRSSWGRRRTPSRRSHPREPPPRAYCRSTLRPPPQSPSQHPSSRARGYAPRPPCSPPKPSCEDRVLSRRAARIAPAATTSSRPRRTSAGKRGDAVLVLRLVPPLPLFSSTLSSRAGVGIPSALARPRARGPPCSPPPALSPGVDAGAPPASPGPTLTKPAY